MIESNDPNLSVAGLGVTVLLLAALGQLIRWVRAATPKPDPWGAEVEAALQSEDATPICHRCLTPHSELAWFCGHCGSAVGTYSNLMPFVYVFSQGEVFRNGVTDKFRVSPLLITGYLLYSLISYAIFAPLFWYFFLKNLQRQKEQTPAASPEVGG